MFRVDCSSHAYDIERAGKSAMCKLTLATLRSYLKDEGVQCSDQLLSELLTKMQTHIATSISILLDPGLKDCYDAWLISPNSSSSHQTMTKARIMYVNSLNDVDVFSPSCFDSLPKADGSPQMEYRVAEQTMSKNLNCRWCKKKFSLDDMSICQCKCAARIGHGECAATFSSEYKERCPVCRTTLLKRKEISKYMFWNIENKFKL